MVETGNLATEKEKESPLYLGQNLFECHFF